MKTYLFLFAFPFFVCLDSQMALTQVTPAVIHCPAQLPVGATVTVTNGMIWGQVGAPVVIRGNQNPMAWEGEDTSRVPLLTVVLTLAHTEPSITLTPTRIMAAPRRCWRPVEAEKAGSGPAPRGTVQPKEGAGCLRGHLLLLSLLVPQRKETWKVEAPQLISSLETAVPTV